MNYDEFLKQKSQLNGNFGFDPNYLPDFLFDFQKHLIEWSLKKGKSAIFADTGLGKCQGINTPILMYDGNFKMVQDIKKNDLLMGVDSKPRKVLSTTVGYGKMFKVTPIKGTAFTCNDVHVLSLKSNSSRYGFEKNKIYNIPLNEYLELNKAQKHILKSWKTGVEFKSKKVSIDPYVVGVWLGDGTANSPDITIGDKDVETRAYLESWAKKNNLITNDKGGNGCSTISYVVSKNNNLKSSNFFRNKIKEFVVNEEKRITKEFLINDRKVRLELLAGLLDSDGYYIDNCYEIITKHRGLADDIEYLVRSLGLAATRRTVTKGIKSRNFEAEYEKILISGEVMPIPCKVERKKPKVRKQIKNVLNTGFKVEYIGKDNYYGFSLDGDHLYLLSDFTVTHNTIQELVWAENVVRKTNGKVLLLTPLAVSHQTVKEAEKFGIEAHRSRDGEAKGKITITNYEQLKKFNSNDFVACVCDESSIMKNFKGQTKNDITRFMNKMQYRLLATATPSPNDFVELGTSSEALGELTHLDMLSRFFRDTQNDKNPAWSTPKFVLKKHSINDFWRWVVSWAIALRKPSDLGYSDEKFILPKLTETEHLLKVTKPLPGELFARKAKGLKEQREERKMTLSQRVEKTSELCENHDVSIIWGHYNYETDALEKSIKGAVQISGSDSDEAKEEKFNAFTDGEIKRLITKPKIGSQGLNWQHCNHMVFFPSHSYEQYYQGVRRCYRFGQKRPVQVDIVTTEGEAGVMNNIKRKAKDSEIMFSKLVEHMNNELKIETKNIDNKKINIPKWI